MADNEVLEELVKRARRIETRIWKLCEKMGVTEAPSVPFVIDKSDPPSIAIPGYDVTLAKIRRELTLVGVDPDGGCITLLINGIRAGRIVFFRE